MSIINRWKFFTIILSIICLGLAYRIFDQGITNTYVNASQVTSNQHIELLKKLIKHEWLGLTEEQIMKRLQSFVDSQSPDLIVLKKDSDQNTIYLEGVRFGFENGNLVSVE